MRSKWSNECGIRNSEMWNERRGPVAKGVGATRVEDVDSRIGCRMDFAERPGFVAAQDCPRMCPSRIAAVRSGIPLRQRHRRGAKLWGVLATTRLCEDGDATGSRVPLEGNPSERNSNTGTQYASG